MSLDFVFFKLNSLSYEIKIVFFRILKFAQFQFNNCIAAFYNLKNSDFINRYFYFDENYELKPSNTIYHSLPLVPRFDFTEIKLFLRSLLTAYLEVEDYFVYLQMRPLESFYQPIFVSNHFLSHKINRLTYTHIFDYSFFDDYVKNLLDDNIESAQMLYYSAKNY